MSRSPSAIIKLRIFVACCVAIFGFVFLIGRLFYLQVIESEEYQRQAAETQLEVTEIAANRGAIYDSNGNKLAMSTTAWTICVAPNNIKNGTDKELIISGLSEILGVSESYLREKCERDTLYAAIKTRVGKEIVEEVTAFATNNGVSRCIFVE